MRKGPVPRIQKINGRILVQNRSVAAVRRKDLQKHSIRDGSGPHQNSQGSPIGRPCCITVAFTLRGTWFQPNNKFGIKIKPATKDDLSAEVRTMADWLKIHEDGGIKHAASGRLAVPTDNVRRNKRFIIPRNQRPKGLAGKAFVLMTKKGPVLAQRISRGKRKGLIVLYGLESSARIKKQPTFHDPIQKVVDHSLTKNIEAGIQNALDTMR
jgi:hypothetical protein